VLRFKKVKQGHDERLPVKTIMPAEAEMTQASNKFGSIKALSAVVDLNPPPIPGNIGGTDYNYNVFMQLPLIL
jgi:hypothetical protein